MTELVHFDEQLLLLINGMHTGFLDSLMWLISAKLVWIPFYISLVYVVWRNHGWRGVGQLLLLVAVMMLLTDTLNSHVIRPALHRYRPANLNSPVGELVHVVNGYRGGKYGFPSAHAANYWGLSLLTFYFVRSKRLLAMLALLTLVVCYSRSYLGVHYPGDLAAGILYATVSVSAIVWLSERVAPLDKMRLNACRKDWIPGAIALFTVLAFAIDSMVIVLF